MSTLRSSVPRYLLRPWIALVAALVVVATLFTAPPAYAADLLEVEPNNTTARAQTLPLGTDLSGTFGANDCDYNDCDVYKLSAPGQGRLTLDLRFSDLLGTNGELDLFVLDAAGTTIYSQDISSADYDGSALGALAMYVDAGVFYVWVSTPAGGIWRDETYTLRADVTPGVVETEKNNTTARADVISLATTIAGSTFDNDCDYDDCDYFRLQMSDASKLSIDLRYSCQLGTGEALARLELRQHRSDADADQPPRRRL